MGSVCVRCKQSYVWMNIGRSRERQSFDRILHFLPIQRLSLENYSPATRSVFIIFSLQVESRACRHDPRKCTKRPQAEAQTACY